MVANERNCIHQLAKPKTPRKTSKEKIWTKIWSVNTCLLLLHIKCVHLSKGAYSHQPVFSSRAKGVFIRRKKIWQRHNLFRLRAAFFLIEAVMAEPAVTALKNDLNMKSECEFYTWSTYPLFCSLKWMLRIRQLARYTAARRRKDNRRWWPPTKQDKTVKRETKEKKKTN